jgi:aryl-alcohol dehydrogenase-like predicted oxidoreductase/histidinol phosphatase-like enzyme/predicted kinase
MTSPADIGMGCMRLSTERDRDPDRAVAVLHDAFDAGITFLDTANAYCWDASEAGHNERLIARAIQTWTGDRSTILIATKGGLTRPEGNWIADGRARHLRAACTASLQALGLERLPLYQLHAPDPRTPLTTSVRALDALKRDGLIAAIGLCNVNVGQIEQARQITEIASVQVELSLWCDDSLMNGVADYCFDNGIRLIAHRPLGGAARRQRVLRDPVLNDVANGHDATPFEVALAWLADLSPLVLPIPGPTTLEHIRSVARASRIVLTEEDRMRLDERFPAGQAVRFRAGVKPERPTDDAGREVLLVMGIPAAGKSTVASGLVEQGYQRLNRDQIGGSLAALLPALDELVAAGATRIVLDNTYVSRKSRAAVIRAAWKRDFAVRCLSLETSLEDAQVNAATRMVSRHGRLLDLDEIRAVARRDPGTFGPSVQFRYQRELEPPQTTEGFSRIDVQRFERRRDPGSTNRALIVWVDGILQRSRTGMRSPVSAEDVDVVAERGEILRQYQSDGWIVCGLSWQPELAERTLRTPDVEAVFARMRERLDVSIDVDYCPHGAGPAACWCRKPLPGLGVLLVERHRLDPRQCVYVGTGVQDPGFARRLGFQYRDADEFFAGAGVTRPR